MQQEESGTRLNWKLELLQDKLEPKKRVLTRSGQGTGLLLQPRPRGRWRWQRGSTGAVGVLHAGRAEPLWLRMLSSRTHDTVAPAAAESPARAVPGPSGQLSAPAQPRSCQACRRHVQLS